MSPSFRRFLTTLTCLAICGCGGGGGGGTRPNQAPDAVPTLVAATFVGAGGTPAAGDRLQLFFSEDVALTPGALLSDLDVVLEGGSLGDVTAPPILKNPRTVVLNLGTGTSFTPGTSTIDLDAGNDVVRDTTGNLAVASTARIIAAGDGDDPSISSITLSGVGSTLNGTGPAGGTLQVPVNGFTVDIAHGDASSAIDTGRSVVLTSVAADVDGVSRQAGLDLADALIVAATAANSSLAVPANVTLPVGSFALTVYVFDVSGMVSDPVTFTAMARTASEDVRPFETRVNPGQVWFIDTSRDIESYSINVLNFVTPAQVQAGANGRSDLEDLFLGLGLLSNSPIPNVIGPYDSNVVVMDLFKNEVLNQLIALHAGTNISFTFANPGPWPGSASVNYNSHGFSRIALTGAEDPSGATGTLGVAIFDPNNRTQDDNTLTDYAGGQRLGVFLHTIVNDGLVAHPTTLFRVTYDPFTTARFGTPIGDDGNDGLRLTLDLLDARTTQIANALQRMARFAAVILAHECGHSVGLVANGAMPVGLYGNDATNFPVFPTSAADGHIKMGADLFPGLSENIMSPAFDFDSALAPETQFNSLNRAYLLERVIADGN